MHWSAEKFKKWFRNVQRRNRLGDVSYSEGIMWYWNGYYNEFCVCVCEHARSRTGFVWLSRGSPVEVTWKQKRSLDINKTGNVHINLHWDANIPQFLQWKINKYYIFWLCICSLSHPACNAHASCCHLWPAGLWDIFSLYLTNVTIFEKKNHLYVLISYTILSETFLILRRPQRYKVKNMCVKYPLFFLGFI